MNKPLKSGVLLFCSIILLACNRTKSPLPAPSPTPRLVEIPLETRPHVNLTSRDDGHMLYLKISKVPENIAQIDYEVLYTAADNGNEIEKGAGDTIRDISSSLERKILLGTESCTNGCKYKYDNGVYGGTISLTFTTQEGQVSTYATQFSLKSGKEIQKAGSIELTTEDIVIFAKPADNNYYVLLKNYGISDPSARVAYTISSSGTSSAKYSKISPETITKADNNLVGEYLVQ